MNAIQPWDTTLDKWIGVNLIESNISRWVYPEVYDLLEERQSPYKRTGNGLILNKYFPETNIIIYLEQSWT